MIKGAIVPNIVEVAQPSTEKEMFDNFFNSDLRSTMMTLQQIRISIAPIAVIVLDRRLRRIVMLPKLRN